MAPLAMATWAVVAGAHVTASAAGWDPVGVGEPVTRLTTVHFTYAGVATTALALAVRRHLQVDGSPGRAASSGSSGSRRSPGAPESSSAWSVGWRHVVGNGGLGLAMVAPPVVALGFLTDLAVAQVGGAVLMTVGVYLIATGHLIEARSTRPGPARWLLAVSGASIWVPMGLAVAWASAQHSGGPALSIPDMVRIHGSLNAIGFVGCGLTARWLATRSEVERGRLRAGADAASPDPAAGVDRACPATTIDPELAIVPRRARRAGRAGVGPSGRADGIPEAAKVGS